MEKNKDILKRYYIGETSTDEERTLREAYRKGELPADPVLGFRDRESELPGGLMENIQSRISGVQRHKRRKLYITLAGIAATLILIVMIRGIRQPKSNPIQLSDNVKIERIEEAFRVIGNVLEEKTTPDEKVLYEDKNIIITIK